MVYYKDKNRKLFNKKIKDVKAMIIKKYTIIPMLLIFLLAFCGCNKIPSPNETVKPPQYSPNSDLPSNKKSAFDEYKKMLKSDIADLKNLGGRFAGTITAGLFIGEFVLERPWLHLDIAGTAWTDAERDYYSKGGTGAGVRTLYYLAKKASRK
jgi:hypothetical protein